MSSFSATPRAGVPSNARFVCDEMPPSPFRATICEAFPNRREATLAEREANVAEREADLAEREAAFALRLAALAEREAELRKKHTQFNRDCEDEIDRQKHWIMCREDQLTSRDYELTSREIELEVRQRSLDSYASEQELLRKEFQEERDHTLAVQLAREFAHG